MKHRSPRPAGIMQPTEICFRQEHAVESHSRTHIKQQMKRTMPRINPTPHDNIMLILGVNHTNLTHFFLKKKKKTNAAALHSLLFPYNIIVIVIAMNGAYEVKELFFVHHSAPP